MSMDLSVLLTMIGIQNLKKVPDIVNSLLFPSIILIIILLLFSQPVLANISHPTFCIPQNGSLLFGVHPPVQYHKTEMDVTEDSISSFLKAAKKNPAIIAFSHEWGTNQSFPHQQFLDIHKTGAIPYVRLMLRTDNKQNKAEPAFTLHRISHGIYDAPLKNWANQARSLGYPIIIEYGTEVNGKWFSWNGYWTGNTIGPSKFKDVYRHIISLMKDEGADNLLWVYHVNWHNNPEESWNTMEAYYPGDEYIDLFGLSIYGALHPDSSPVLSFSDMMNQSYPELAALHPQKPIIIAEMGTDNKNRSMNPVVWTKEALEHLVNGTWPRVIGFIWWNSAWPNDNIPSHNTSMRIEENNQMITLFRNIIAPDERFLNRTYQC